MERLEERGCRLRMGQMPALLQVWENPGITQEGVCRTVGMDKGTTGRAVKSLEEDGLVTRTVDPRDRRYKRVRLTARCRELTEQIGRQGQKTFDQFFRGFTPGELETLNQLLERLLENCGEPSQTNHRPEETE